MEQQMAAAAQQRHKHGRKPISQKVVTSIIDGLKQIYFHKVRANSSFTGEPLTCAS
jgi:hypothetical protein